jgi:hypothetical protein
MFNVGQHVRIVVPAGQGDFFANYINGECGTITLQSMFDGKYLVERGEELFAMVPHTWLEKI